MAAQPPAAAPVNYDQFVRKLAFPRPLSFLLCTALLASVFFVAVRIRLFAVITYGRIIHEFDPWFNYRATEYMVEHGWTKFQATKLPLERHTQPAASDPCRKSPARLRRLGSMTSRGIHSGATSDRPRTLDCR